MYLSGTGAPALKSDLTEIAACHFHARRALTHTSKVDVERPLAIQRTQSAYAIPRPRKQNLKLGLILQRMTPLQGGRCHEANGQSIDSRRIRGKRHENRFRCRVSPMEFPHWFSVGV